MPYKEWKEWFKSIPWSYRWFLIFILIRPITDNFYYLKNISAFYSPLYILGFVTPFFCYWPIYKKKRMNNTSFDNLWKFYGFILFITSALTYFPIGQIFYFLLYFLKLTMVIYLYFFIRILVRSKRDLDGIITTFLYSGIIIMAVFLYELFFGPIRQTERTSGVYRMQGGYADIMNYAIYFTWGFLLVTYYYLQKRREFHFGLKTVLFILVVCVLGLININQISSFIVFTAIFFLFLIYLTRIKRATQIITFLFVIGIGAITYSSFIFSQVETVFKNEEAVISGEKDIEQFGHGRMGRWDDFIDLYSSSSILSKTLGMPFDNIYLAAIISVHNQFLVILGMNGILGIIVFTFSLFLLFKRIKFLRLPEKYLAIGAILIFLLYSMATTPLLYVSFLYIMLPIFAYLQLPRQILINEG